GSARDKNIHVPVVVVIGLHTVESAQLIGQAGRLGTVFKGAIALVPVEGHRGRRVQGCDNYVQQAVVVEIFHDSPAGVVETIDAELSSNITEPADVELT